MKNEDLKEKMKESWQDLEDWHQLEESIWKGSKRKVDESTMPDLPEANNVSPRSVVLFPGDEGYEEYIEQCEGEDSSKDDGSEDEGDEQEQVHGI